MTYTTMNTAAKMDIKPAQVSHATLWNVRTLAAAMTTTVARKDHHTVQAAWVERALRPMDTPRMPEPVQRTYLNIQISTIVPNPAYG